MEWFAISTPEILGIFITTISIYFILLIMIKINGLRSFAKMSSHDFAVTIAIGSILGAITIQKEPSLLQGAFAIGFFLLLQFLYSSWRIFRPQAILENEPLLLMKGSEILYDNLKTAKITENDLMAKLREANVLKQSDVQAVIMESSGDVSVMHGDKTIDDKILQDVHS